MHALMLEDSYGEYDVQADMLRLGAWLERQQRKVHDRFVEAIVPELVRAGVEYRVAPLVLVAMAAHETNFGNFTGAVPASYHNTCGLRVVSRGTTRHDVARHLLEQLAEQVEGVSRDAVDEVRRILLMLSHDCSPSWRVGAVKHAQHVRAYAGATLDLDADDIIDPRFYLVRSLGRSASTAGELGELWASRGYGDTLERWLDAMDQLPGVGSS